MGRVFTTGQYTYRINEGTLEARYDKVKGEFFKCFTTEAWTGIARLVLQEHDRYDAIVADHVVDVRARDELGELQLQIFKMGDDVRALDKKISERTGITAETYSKLAFRVKELEEKARDGIPAVDHWGRGELNVHAAKIAALTNSADHLQKALLKTLEALNSLR